MKGVVEGARRSQAAALKRVSIADYLKLELCICIFSSYSLLACSYYYYFFLGGGGYAGVFRISEVLSIRVRDVSIFDFMKV